MAMPWGILTDQTAVKIFDFYTRGYSVNMISRFLNITEVVVLEHIKSVPFQADLKLLQDDIDYQEMMSPTARISRLQHEAIDVLAEEMLPGKKNRLAAADSVLDRGRDVPKARVPQVGGDSVPAEALSFVAKVIRELGAGIASGLAGTLKDPVKSAIPIQSSSD